MISQRKKKYLLILLMNIIVTLFCLSIFVHFISLSVKKHDSKDVEEEDIFLYPVETAGVSPKVSNIIAILVVVVYIFYVIYHIRFYLRLIERIRIFNNQVWEVFDIGDRPDKAQVRHNLSSFVNQSELAHTVV